MFNTAVFPFLFLLSWVKARNEVSAKNARTNFKRFMADSIVTGKAAERIRASSLTHTKGH